MHVDTAGGRRKEVGPAMWGCECEPQPDPPPARAELPLVTRLAQSVSAGAMGRPHPPAHSLGPKSLVPNVVAANALGALSVGCVSAPAVSRKVGGVAGLLRVLSGRSRGFACPNVRVEVRHSRAAFCHWQTGLFGRAEELAHPSASALRQSVSPPACDVFNPEPMGVP